MGSKRFGPSTVRGELGGFAETLAGLLFTAVWMPMLTLAGDFSSALALVVVQWVGVAMMITPSLAYMADVTSFGGGEIHRIFKVSRD